MPGKIKGKFTPGLYPRNVQEIINQFDHILISRNYLFHKFFLFIGTKFINIVSQKLNVIAASGKRSPKLMRSERNKIVFNFLDFPFPANVPEYNYAAHYFIV